MDNKNALVASTKTAANGSYSFKQLPAGDYRVVTEDALRTTAPSGGYTDLSGAAKLVNGQAASNVNFELTSNVLLDGTVYVDLNNNGSPDKGEAIANDTITITSKSTSKVVATLKTDSNGFFSTSALPAGIYTVTAAPTAGDVFSSPASLTVTLAAAAVDSVTFKEAKQKQSTDLNGSYTGTVNGNAATLVFSSQDAAAKTIMGTLLVPGLFNLKSSGLFTGSISATGAFSYSRKNSNGTTTLSGQESLDGATLTGFLNLPVFGDFAFTFQRTA